MLLSSNTPPSSHRKSLSPNPLFADDGSEPQPPPAPWVGPPDEASAMVVRGGGDKATRATSLRNQSLVEGSTLESPLNGEEPGDEVTRKYRSKSGRNKSASGRCVLIQI